MLIGILSDTHGRHLEARRAMELFESAGVAHIIHCGDVCGLDVFDQFVGQPFSFVWGNCDFDDGSTLAYLKTVGLKPPDGVPLRLSLGGKSFAVFHGHEPAFVRAELLGVDYVLHGHSHVARDERVGGVRFINPGALYRASRKTVATLDTTSDKLQFHEIKS